ERTTAYHPRHMPFEIACTNQLTHHGLVHRAPAWSARGLAFIRMRLRADEANLQPCIPGDRYHVATTAIAQLLIDVFDLPGWQPVAVELEGHAIHAGMRARPDVPQDRYAVGASCIR